MKHVRLLFATSPSRLDGIKESEWPDLSAYVQHQLQKYAEEGSQGVTRLTLTYVPDHHLEPDTIRLTLQSCDVQEGYPGLDQLKLALELAEMDFLKTYRELIQGTASMQVVPIDEWLRRNEA